MPRHTTTTLAALLLLSACSAEAEPKTEPTPSATPSRPTVVPAPTSTPSKQPAVYLDHEEAIRAWFKAESDMQNTGDTGPYLALTNGKCSSCNDFAETVETTYATGGKATNAGREVRSISEFRDAQGIVWQDVRTTSQPMTVWSDSSAAPRNISGGAVRLLVLLEFTDRGWLVTDMRIDGEHR